nr:hypothetical protein [uncultured Celeribacter sp.]
MTKDLLIFGNGLGRSLDNDFFSLDRALQEAWDDTDVLDDAQKELILRCLPSDILEDDEDSAPRSEEDLDQLQQILAACDLINELENETTEGWLTAQGKTFPNAIRSYVHRAACDFHFGDYKLPETFAASLRQHVIKTKSHVATLNYDNLLYRNFIGTDVFNGFSCLIDGFSNGTFSKENLRRFNTRKTSYYLHLHGSPLFYDDAHNVCHKAAMAETDLLAGNASGHIVLTNVRHKRSVIAASPVLTAYWKILEKRALKEARRITLFGYSGFDEHLNLLIQKKCRTDEKCSVRVVEREASGSRAERQSYWNDKFDDVELITIPDILDFTDW